MENTKSYFIKMESGESRTITICEFAIRNNKLHIAFAPYMQYKEDADWLEKQGFTFSCPWSCNISRFRVVDCHEGCQSCNKG